MRSANSAAENASRRELDISARKNFNLQFNFLVSTRTCKTCKVCFLLNYLRQILMFTFLWKRVCGHLSFGFLKIVKFSIAVFDFEINKFNFDLDNRSRSSKGGTIDVCKVVDHKIRSCWTWVLFCQNCFISGVVKFSLKFGIFFNQHLSFQKLRISYAYVLLGLILGWNYFFSAPKFMFEEKNFFPKSILQREHERNMTKMQDARRGTLFSLSQRTTAGGAGGATTQNSKLSTAAMSSIRQVAGGRKHSKVSRLTSVASSEK